MAAAEGGGVRKRNTAEKAKGKGKAVAVDDAPAGEEKTRRQAGAENVNACHSFF